MIIKNARILTVVSCRKMHDHGALSVMWKWFDADPFALHLIAEGTDQMWHIDRIGVHRAMIKAAEHPGTPIECGVASVQLRASNPAALSLRMTTYVEGDVHYTYLISSAFDVAQYLDDINKIAPNSYSECGVDTTIEKILSS